MPVIRAATTADMQSVASIYAHYVRNTAATFEIAPPDVDEMQQRRETILLAGLPYLVVEVNKSVVGYAYAGQYRPVLRIDTRSRTPSTSIPTPPGDVLGSCC